MRLLELAVPAAELILLSLALTSRTLQLDTEDYARLHEHLLDEVLAEL